MNYEQLLSLECPCGSSRFSMEGSIEKRTGTVPPVPAVICHDWCAYRQRLVSGNGLKASDCQECRSLQVIEGRVTCNCGRSWPIHNGNPDFGERKLAEWPDADLTVVETDADGDPRWDPFVRSQEDSLLYHSSLWLKVLEAEFGQPSLSLAAVDRKGCFQGVLPMSFTRGFPFGIKRIGGHRVGRRLCSLPRTPVAGPLCSSREAAAALLSEAIRRVQSNPNVTLELKTNRAWPPDLIHAFQKVLWRETYTLELPGRDVATVRFGNAKQQHRIVWGVNKALQKGVFVSEAWSEHELREWYELYLATMRRVVAPARAYRIFEQMWRYLRPRRMMKLLVARTNEHDHGKLLAGSVFLQDGRTVHYAFTGCCEAAFALHANDLIQWESIQRANRDGCRIYDFGEVVEGRQGLAEFKSKWCATPSRLFRYYFPAKTGKAERFFPEGGVRVAGPLWQRMPLSATAYIGSRLYSYL